jgi:formate dehydrogenase subunit beta
MVNLADLRGEVARVLKDGKVKYVVAYELGTDGVRARPGFIRDASEAERVVWDPTCFHNLVRFLVEEKRKKARETDPDLRPIGIIAKGCDSRALVVLLQEKFIGRGDVHLIGVSCEDAGVVDEKKLAGKLAGRVLKGVKFGKGGYILAATDNGTIEIPAQEVLADRCLDCRASAPTVQDVLFGDVVKRQTANPFGSVEKVEALSQPERWEFWKQHLDRCIRCYECRSVCPMCYCDECVADTISFAVTAETSADEKAQKIKWVEKSPVTSENMTYHLVRAMHLGGRCIDCGECERACPVDIPLRLLNKKLEKEAREMFGYDPGSDPDAPPLVSSFKDDDPEDFIR